MPKRNTYISELRKYDDPAHPETSPYDVIIPSGAVPSSTLAVGYVRGVAEEEDINTIFAAGTYYVAAGTVHWPGSTYGILEVVYQNPSGGGARCFQRATVADQSSSVFVRRSNQTPAWTAWMPLAPVEPVWNEIPLLNGASGTIRYYKQGALVTVQGLAVKGVTTAFASYGTLPSGYRPAGGAFIGFVAVNPASASMAPQTWRIMSNGNISLANPSAATDTAQFEFTVSFYIN